MATKKTAAAPKAAEKKTTTKAAAPKAPKADVTAKAAEKVVAKAEVPAAAAKAEVSVVAAAPAAPVVASPSREAIGKRAFELFVARGGANGNAFEDWVRAERELMGASAN